MGTIGLVLPVIPVNAETTPPYQAPVENLSLASGAGARETLPDGPASGTTAPAPLREDSSIRPFHYHASDEALADLRRRLSMTKWPPHELVSDASQGVQLATMQALAR